MEIVLLSFIAVFITILGFVISWLLKGRTKPALILLSSAVLSFLLLYYIVYRLFTPMSSGKETRLHSPAEDSLLYEYQARYPDADIVFLIDQFAEDKTYRYYYGHGVYNVRFTSRHDKLDFRQFGEDSLSRISKDLVTRVTPAILHRSCYDSFKVTFVTGAPVPHNGTIRPGAQPYIRTFVYAIRM
jgi:hypothetical protein